MLEECGSPRRIFADSSDHLVSLDKPRGRRSIHIPFWCVILNKVWATWLDALVGLARMEIAGLGVGWTGANDSFRVEAVMGPITHATRSNKRRSTFLCLTHYSKNNLRYICNIYSGEPIPKNVLFARIGPALGRGVLEQNIIPLHPLTRNVSSKLCFPFK